MHVIEVASSFFVFAGLFLLKGVQCSGIIFPGLLQFSAELLTQSDLLTIWEMLCFQGTLGSSCRRVAPGFRTSPRRRVPVACLVYIMILYILKEK